MVVAMKWSSGRESRIARDAGGVFGCLPTVAPLMGQVKSPSTYRHIAQR